MSKIEQIVEDYVSFDLAKLLKKKGFDEFTFSDYNLNGIAQFNEVETRVAKGYQRPTLQMACRWLTAAHNLFITFELDFSDGAYPMFDAVVYNLATCEKYPIINYDRYSYIKGTEAAIKYCLENLI
jgi:hypothetical protein